MTTRTVERPLSLVADLIAQLAIKLDAAPINTRFPEGWVCKVDEHWTVAANGQREPVTVGDGTVLAQITLEPFGFGVWWNGWAVARLDWYGGIFLGPGFGAEDELIEAIRRRIEVE